MPQQYSVVVLFKADRLPPEGRHDRARRKELVQQGMDALRTVFPTALFGAPNPTALSVTVSVTGDVLGDLVCYLESSGLGRYIVDGQLLKAVSKGPVSPETAS